jgi:hypothetical protein
MSHPETRNLQILSAYQMKHWLSFSSRTISCLGKLRQGVKMMKGVKPV